MKQNNEQLASLSSFNKSTQQRITDGVVGTYNIIEKLAVMRAFFVKA